jgi:hypothetical protein
MADLLRWLGQTPLAEFMRASAWAYPLTEALHIMGIALLAGAAALFDLRLLGMTPALPVTVAARHLLRTSHLGLLVTALSGGLLFSAGPLEMAANSAFRIKLALIAAAGLNALLFHLRPFRGVRNWDDAVVTPPAARAAALVSLVLWAAVIVCGRLIGYV